MHVSVSVRGLRKCNVLSFFSSGQTGVIARGIDQIQKHFISVCNVNSVLNRFHYPRCQQSSSTMAQAAVATPTPTEVNSPVSGEKTTTKEATESSKRKSDEPGEPETSGRGKRRRGAGGKKLRPGERYIPPPQKRNLGISFRQEHFDETSYYFEGGLRKVYPYYFDFKTYCKGRWIGKSLLEVFKSEFRAESIEYYQRAAKEGRIRLNETPVEDLSVVLRVSVTSTYDFMSEVPVLCKHGSMTE